MISVIHIDDEAELLAIRRAFLEKSGNLKVTTEKPGPEGLQRLSERSIAVIVPDYKMEGMQHR